MQGVQDLSLLLHSRVPLRIDARLDPPEVSADRVQLVLERLDPVLSLLLDQVLQVLHPVVTPHSLGLHVVGLFLDPEVEQVSHVLQHAEVVILKLFELVVDLLALVDRVLLVVLDLLVHVLELELKPSLGIVPQTHHLVEVTVHLAHLVAQTAQLQVVAHCCLIHFRNILNYFV